MTSLGSNTVLRMTARALQIIVAVVFLVAAVLKAFDPLAFAEQIRMYQVTPSLAGLAAWVFIILEVMIAAALALNFLPRLTGILAVLLLVFFIGVTVYGELNLNLEGCGCFGTNIHRSFEQVIIEDVLMMAAVIFSTMVLWGRRSRGTLWKGIIVVGFGGLAALTAATAYRLPVDSLVTELRVGKTIASWPVEGLSRNLYRGVHLVFLFSAKSPTIQSDVTMMNTAAQQNEIPSTIGLVVENTAAASEVMFRYGCAFPVAAIEPRFARTLYRTLPRAFVLRDGRIEVVWLKIPTPGEAKREVARVLQARERKE
ncbi:MAG: hypothetical protein QHI48_02460 [Bacteroidota bacterium]|nr:hypothetical protein [Bacteroidota bacterium]